MGSTNKTNIGLSQFIATDKPSWLGDYNGDMRTISKQIDDLNVNTSSIIAGKLTLIDSQIAQLTDDVLKNTDDIAVNTTSIASIAVRMAAAETDIKTLDQRERDHYNAVTKNLDTHTDDLKALEDRQTYFAQNMDRIEDMAVLSTASIAKMEIRLHTAEVDIANLKEETDLLSQDSKDTVNKLDAVETQTRTNTADITTQADAIQEHNTAISALEQSVAALGQSAEQIPKNTDAIAQLQGRMTDAETSIQANSTNIDTLQDITKNISSGVQVPFGFGTSADSKQGYLSPDGTLNPFVTPQEYMDLQDDINGNTTDISDINGHIKNITKGASLPFSLGIAPGGAYGYIKNGELGVTPWVEESEVVKMVDLQPIQADVQALSGSVSTLSTSVSTHADEIQTVQADVETLTSEIGTIQDTITGIKPYDVSKASTTLAIYISNQGSDSNDGLTPDTPILSMTQLSKIIAQYPAYQYKIFGLTNEGALLSGYLKCNSILLFVGTYVIANCSIMAPVIEFATQDAAADLTLKGNLTLYTQTLVANGNNVTVTIDEDTSGDKWISLHNITYPQFFSSNGANFTNIDMLNVEVRGCMLLLIPDATKPHFKRVYQSLLSAPKAAWTNINTSTNGYVNVS